MFIFKLARLYILRFPWGLQYAVRGLQYAVCITIHVMAHDATSAKVMRSKKSPPYRTETTALASGLPTTNIIHSRAVMGRDLEKTYVAHHL